MMQDPGHRRLALVAVLVVLAGAVAVDRLGLLEPGAGVPAQQRYALALAQIEQQRELVRTAPQVEQEIEGLRAAWERLEPGVVAARTVELAPAALRDRVRGELTSAGVQDLRVLSEEVRQERPEGAPAGAVPMRIRVSFDADDAQVLYRAIERIEQSRTLLARVGDVQLRGGGFNEVSQRVTATLTIDTVVLVGEEG